MHRTLAPRIYEEGAPKGQGESEGLRRKILVTANRKERAPDPATKAGCRLV